MLVAAKGTTVQVRTKGPSTVVVGRANEWDGVDAVGVESSVSVEIETTTRIIEAVRRDEQTNNNLSSSPLDEGASDSPAPAQDTRGNQFGGLTP